MEVSQSQINLIGPTQMIDRIDKKKLFIFNEDLLNYKIYKNIKL